MELGAGRALAGRTGRAAGAGVGRRGRQQGAGRWTQSRVAGLRTGASVRQALGVRGRAGGRCRRAGAGGQRQAERAAGWASGSSAQGARQAGRAAAGRAGRHGVGAQGRAAGRTVRAGHGRPGHGLGAGGWQTGPAGPVLVHCAPGSVLARFLAWFDSIFFSSHQMNTVHCEIKFFEKKNI